MRKTSSTACTSTKSARHNQEDYFVFRNDNEPNRYHFAGTTEDGKYVVLNTSTGTDGNSFT